MNPAKPCVRKILRARKKNLRTRNCRRRFLKKLLPEKRKENMETKQPRFKSRLKILDSSILNRMISREVLCCR